MRVASASLSLRVSLVGCRQLAGEFLELLDEQLRRLVAKHGHGPSNKWRGEKWSATGGRTREPTLCARRCQRPMVDPPFAQVQRAALWWRAARLLRRLLSAAAHPRPRAKRDVAAARRQRAQAVPRRAAHRPRRPRVGALPQPRLRLPVGGVVARLAHLCRAHARLAAEGTRRPPSITEHKPPADLAHAHVLHPASNASMPVRCRLARGDGFARASCVCLRALMERCVCMAR
jgi:hypothetical protein